MKITKRQLRRIIKEEKARLLEQMHPNDLQNRDMEWEAADRREAGALVDAAEESIEEILNDLWEQGVENDGLLEMLQRIIKNINSGFVGERT